jgi:ubiquinone/menaquinone biosynthesis C-methylase UbiE
LAVADAKGAVQAQFGANAEKYVSSPTHARGDDLDLVVPWLQPQPAWIALDVATGGGHVAKALSPRVATVVAADLTVPMLAAARRHLDGAGCRNVVYVAADAEALPFLDGAFDCVTCRIAAHHFPDPRRFVAEAARVLRPGGRLLLIDNVAPEDPALGAFFNELERMRDPSHVYAATPAEWRSWLAAVGLVEKSARMGRKTHEFRQWVERTATSPEQIGAVEAFALAATAPAREHFAIQVEGGRMASWTADDLTLLAEKG